MRLATPVCKAQLAPKVPLLIWLWVKIGYPNGTLVNGAVTWWLNFDPYPYALTELRSVAPSAAPSVCSKLWDTASQLTSSVSLPATS